MSLPPVLNSMYENLANLENHDAHVIEMHEHKIAWQKIHTENYERELRKRAILGMKHDPYGGGNYY